MVLSHNFVRYRVHSLSRIRQTLGDAVDNVYNCPCLVVCNYGYLLFPSV